MTRREALACAGEHAVLSLRHLILTAHYAEAAGPGLEISDLVADLDQLAADLRLVRDGHVTVADLRPECPEHMIRAAVAYRRDRARQSGGKVPA